MYGVCGIDKYFMQEVLPPLTITTASSPYVAKKAELSRISDA
jgi:hypothetical protein